MASKNTRTNPFAQTRKHHALETAEDYVEAVAAIIDEKGECRVLHLAAYFGVSHVTVSRIVRRLQEEKLLKTKPYKPIELTSRGKTLAERVKKRHEIVLAFLIALGVDQQTAEIDSEGIEHHVSETTLAAMKRYIDET